MKKMMVIVMLAMVLLMVSGCGCGFASRNLVNKWEKIDGYTDLSVRRLDWNACHEQALAADPHPGLDIIPFYGSIRYEHISKPVIEKSLDAWDYGVLPKCCFPIYALLRNISTINQ